MYHKRIFCGQLFGVFNEMARVVILTGNGVTYIIFTQSIINKTRWQWSLTFISMLQIKYVRV